MYEVTKKRDREWKLQMPHGVLTYRTKRAALAMAEACKQADAGRIESTIKECPACHRVEGHHPDCVALTITGLD